MGHLSAHEVVAAVDGDLSSRRRAHLDRCPRCQRAVTAVRETIAATVPAGEVPEPSPLFWDHLGTRIRQATAGEPVPSGGTRWGASAWGAVAATAVVVFALLALWLPGSDPGAPSVARGDPADENGPEVWGEVVAVAGALSPEEIQWLFQPEAPVMIDDLTADERAAFAALLTQEMEAIE